MGTCSYDRSRKLKKKNNFNEDINNHSMSFNTNNNSYNRDINNNSEVNLLFLDLIKNFNYILIK